MSSKKSINNYIFSMVTLNNEHIFLKFDLVDEDFDLITLTNGTILYVYRIAPNHPDIQPYYKVEYSVPMDKVEYMKNDEELRDWLRSFFYSTGYEPVISSEEGLDILNSK